MLNRLLLCMMLSVTFFPNRPFGVQKDELEAFVQKVERSDAQRLELLRHSRGRAKMVLSFSKPPSHPEYVPGGSKGQWKSATGSWTTEWYQSGNKYRYDVESDSPQEGSQTAPLFPSPYFMRLAADNESSTYYSVTHNQAYLGRPIPRISNPWGLRRSFKVEYLYNGKFNTSVLRAGLATSDDAFTIELTEEEYLGRKCLKWSCLGKDPRIKEQSLMWFDPSMAYSLVHAEMYDNAEARENNRPESEMNVVSSYDADYEQSDTAEGVWLLTKLRIYDFSKELGGEDLSVTFEKTEIGVDVADETFTFKGLGVPEGALVYDKRVSGKITQSYYKDLPKDEMDTPGPENASTAAAAKANFVGGVKEKGQTAGGNQ